MSSGIFQIEGLAGFRIDVIGFTHDEGYQVVTHIAADTHAEAEAELKALLIDPEMAGWERLYSAPYAAWAETCFLKEEADSAEERGLRLR